MIFHSKPWITEVDTSYVEKQIKNNALADKSALAIFEEKLKEKTQGKKVILCSSGTAALYLVLSSLDLKEKDEVILPTYVCKSVYDSVKLIGAVPVLCDVGEDWNMSPDTVAPHVNQNTKAIILVNLFGITESVGLFRQFGVTIINDLCQNFDAGICDVKNDSDRGDYLFFSFHATKCLTTGLGGAVIVDEEKRIDLLTRAWEKFKDIISMSDVQAALGISQINRYTDFQDRRSKLASLYFNNIPNKLTSNLMNIKPKWNGYRFLIKHPDINFEEYMRLFLEKEIIVRRGVDVLLHRNLNLSDDLFPKATKNYNQTISIPFYPALTDSEAERVIKACVI